MKLRAYRNEAQKRAQGDRHSLCDEWISGLGMEKVKLEVQLVRKLDQNRDGSQDGLLDFKIQDA